MAILKAGALGSPSGNLGGICFAQGRGATTVRTRGIAPNHSSLAAQKARSDFAHTAAMWQSVLTSSQRQAWVTFAQRTPVSNRFGTPRIISGFQWFMRSAAMTPYQGFTSTQLPGYTRNYSIASFSVTYGASSHLEVTSTGNYIAGLTIETIYISRFAHTDPTLPANQAPPSRPFWLRLLQIVKTADIMSYDAQLAVFGQRPISGESWAWKTSWSDPETLPSNPYIASIIPTL